MLKEFIRNGLSAAGVSHVVTGKSIIRRMLWIVLLVAVSLTMMYMTYNVLQEYLKYTIVFHKKKVSQSDMEFPAVTVCSYIVIPRHNAKEAHLQHMDEIVKVLDSLPVYNISMDKKLQCVIDPLCRFSRFTDECSCDKSACTSTECFSFKNRTFCSCSENLCRTSLSHATYDCTVEKERGGNECVCKIDSVYSKYNKKNNRLTPDFLEALENLDASPEVKTLLRHLKNSTTIGLQDIDKFIKPNITVRDDYGVAFENLVVSCTFGAMPCNISNVNTLYSPTYGKCYMFNYAGENHRKVNPKVVHHPGKTNGLELFLKAPEADTFSLLSAQYGARVVIHDPRSLPFASEKGFDIRAGDMTSVMVQRKYIYRLGPPWGDCARDGDNKTSSYLKIPYDMLGCSRQCLSDKIFRKCKCYHPFGMSGSLAPDRKFLCKEKDDKCILPILLAYIRNKIDCNCPPACREKTYDVTISASKINTDFFHIVKTARSLKIINGRPAVVEPELDLGMMGLQVYFGSFCVTNVTEASTYSWEFLISNIGGNLGLFLGLSLITFVEIAEFIVDITAQTFCRKKRSHR